MEGCLLCFFLLFLVIKNIVSHDHQTFGEIFAKGRKA